MLTEREHWSLKVTTTTVDSVKGLILLPSASSFTCWQCVVNVLISLQNSLEAQQEQQLLKLHLSVLTGF